ncbi:hypothetical protein [Corallococcus sp. AB018]|uniref:SitA5 family polymorphic toxin n=1 Tax=Corallococcus sp. AB018 TaxID=2316715 RepID=UPI0027D2E2DD|nr:hypothetical protein [Corallococcus sp. AB018]
MAGLFPKAKAFMTNRLVVSVLVLSLLGACANRPGLRLDLGQGRTIDYVPRASMRPVVVDADAFEEALSAWVLEFPLSLRTERQPWLVRAAYPGSTPDASWRSLMRKSFGGICRANQESEDCLSLFANVSALSEADRLGVALGLSVGPLKSSIAKAVEDTLAPQLFYTVIATGLITWAVLAANPEPVFTKSAAVISAILLIYLGVETFLTVLEASRELKRATEKATSAGELEQAGQHFANRVGPEVARVFILAVTVVVSQGMTGGAASLASRLSRMPGYPEAAVVGATRVGIELAQVGQVSAVAIAGDTIVVSLPATAVAMVARNGASSNSTPSGPRSWGSFSGLKRALGPAEDGKQWHHIVEQTPGNVNRFGPEAVHNTENVIQLDQGLHKRLSGFYSSIQQEITGSRTLTVRQWLSTQSFEAQRDFGLQAIEKIQKRIWGVWK